MRKIILTAVLLLAFNCFATDRLVPGGYATIQLAITAASGGDTIIVSPDTYTENIDFCGKNITLTSTNPDDWDVVAATIIQGDGTREVVRFSGSENNTCTLTGLTITGGNNSNSGGGISGNSATANINRCIIRNNATQSSGGAIQGVYGSISHCIIFQNSADYHGGGLAGCSIAEISNCLIYDNSSADGSGINNCDGDIINCTIAFNPSGDGSEMRNCDGNIANCIIWDDGGSGQLSNCSEPTYSCYPNGSSGTGNIDSNPFFVDAASDDYRLTATSPCVDMGTNTPAGGLPGADIDGGPRPIDGNDDGTPVADMGAYEVSGICINRDSFGFFALQGGPDPNDQILQISYNGLGTIGWEITENTSWLYPSPISGTVAAETDEVSLHVDPSGLAAGIHNCTMTVSSPQALNSPLTIDVLLRIGNEIHVPADHSIIQDAIIAASNGDVIIVEPDTYTENINFLNKKIKIS